MTSKKCKFAKCGKQFKPNHRKQKFCSTKCRVYYHRDLKTYIDELNPKHLIQLT